MNGASRCTNHPQTAVITSPAEVVATYCDVYVCLCVCLSVREDICGTTGAISTKFVVHISPGRGFLPPLKVHYRPGKGDRGAQRG